MPDLDPVADRLRQVQAPDAVKADVWDAFHHSATADDFAAKVKRLQIPDVVKADLWDMKQAARTAVFASSNETDAAGHAVIRADEPTATNLAIWGEIGMPPGVSAEKPYGAIYDAAKQWVAAGPHAVVEGVRDVAAGNYAKGAHQIVRGGAVTAAPFYAPALARALVAAPIATATSIAGGTGAAMVAEPIAIDVARGVGATEDQAQLAGDAAMLVGGWGGSKVTPAQAVAAYDAVRHPWMTVGRGIGTATEAGVAAYQARQAARAAASTIGPAVAPAVALTPAQTSAARIDAIIQEGLASGRAQVGAAALPTEVPVVASPIASAPVVARAPVVPPSAAALPVAAPVPVAEAVAVPPPVPRPVRPPQTPAELKASLLRGGLSEDVADGMIAALQRGRGNTGVLAAPAPVVAAAPPAVPLAPVAEPPLAPTPAPVAAPPAAAPVDRFKAITDARVAHRADVERELAQLQGNALLEDARTGRRLRLHPSTREPGRWQATAFDAEGQPSGHTTFDSLAEAYRSARGVFGREPPIGAASYRPLNGAPTAPSAAAVSAPTGEPPTAPVVVPPAPSSAVVPEATATKPIMSPQMAINEVGIAARRLKVSMTLDEARAAAEFVQQGSTPQRAIHQWEEAGRPALTVPVVARPPAPPPGPRNTVMSPQMALNEVGQAARRLNVPMTLEEAQQAAALVQQGLTPKAAITQWQATTGVPVVVPGAVAPAVAEAPAGLAPVPTREDLAAELAARLGLPSPAAAEAAIDARNASGQIKTPSAPTAIRMQAAADARIAAEKAAGAAAGAAPNVEPVVPAPAKPRLVKPATATVEPATTAAETPAAAAEAVTNQIERVVDTQGAKSGAAVQARVMKTLSEELNPAREAAGFGDITTRRTGSTGGAVLVDGEPVATWDKNGHVRWLGGGTGMHGRSLGPAADVLPGVPGDTPISITRTSSSMTPGEVERAAKNAVASTISRTRGAGQMVVRIPGDGTFTIDRNTHAINELMKRLQSAGVSIWKDLL